MLRRFFQDYEQLEGKAVKVDEIRPTAEAFPIVTDALHRYSEQRRKSFKEPQPTKLWAFSSAEISPTVARASRLRRYQTRQAFSATIGCPALQPHAF
jgi:hypothetical protein